MQQSRDSQLGLYCFPPAVTFLISLLCDRVMCLSARPSILSSGHLWKNEWVASSLWCWKRGPLKPSAAAELLLVLHYSSPRVWRRIVRPVNCLLTVIKKKHGLIHAEVWPESIFTIHSSPPSITSCRALIIIHTHAWMHALPSLMRSMIFVSLCAELESFQLSVSATNRGLRNRQSQKHETCNLLLNREWNWKQRTLEFYLIEKKKINLGLV